MPENNNIQIKILKDYADIFQMIDICFLLREKKDDNKQEYSYTLCMRTPLAFAIFSIREDKELLISELLKTDIEIKDELPYTGKTFEQLIEMLWTDEKDEYVLIRLKRGKYRIHNKVLNQSIQLTFTDPNQYDLVIENMINAGVEIWNKFLYEE